LSPDTLDKPLPARHVGEGGSARAGGVIRKLLLAVALTALSACNLAPVYSGGSASPSAVMLTQIEIAQIPDRPGFLVRQALLDRFGRPAGTQRYRLEVALDDQIVAFGVRGDNSAARERRTLRARYRLVDVTSNAVLLDATAGSDIGIDRVSSNYAVVAAETTALERLSIDLAGQITARLAQFARATPAER
jgi:LPS-assembly lipoprotein